MANSKDIVDSIRAIKKIQEADTTALPPAIVTGNAVAQSNGNPIANQGTRQPANQGTKDITNNNNNNNNEDNNKNLPQLTEGMINYFLFSANPFLPGVSSTQAICNEYKKLPNECNPIIIVSNSGGDGAFDINCFASFKNHKFGASFPAKDGSATVLTSFKTFAKMILDKIGGNNEKQQSSPETPSQSQQNEIQDSGGGLPATINESTRNRMLNKILREGDSNQTFEGKGGKAAQTIKGANTFDRNNNVNLSHGIKIYTDSYYLKKLDKSSEFSSILGIKWKSDGTTGTFGPNNTPIILDTQTLSGINADAVRKAGTEVFQSILEYINGKKSGTASARGTADTIKSQKMNESTLLKEGDDGENHTSGDWSWESLKVNQGAKQYLSRLYGSVQAIKEGLDDGGNPSMVSRIGKRIASEIGKTFGSALTDGADLMMQGFGLGWMMPLIKAGIEEFQKENDNKQYEGIEAWVRDPSFAKISQYFGNPKDFIEGSEGTK